MEVEGGERDVHLLPATFYPREGARYRWGRLHRLAPVRAAAGGWLRGHLPRQLRHRLRRQHQPAARRPSLRGRRPRPGRGAARRGAGGGPLLPPGQPGQPQPAQPAQLHGAAARDRARQLGRHAATCWTSPSAPAGGCCSPPPRRSTATRSNTRSGKSYWGNVSSTGPRSLLRRGEALRRGVVHDLRPLARRRRAAHSHLQHLRPAHGPRRRANAAQLHHPGARGSSP